jgi:hypothetical protein
MSYRKNIFQATVVDLNCPFQEWIKFEGFQEVKQNILKFAPKFFPSESILLLDRSVKNSF